MSSQCPHCNGVCIKRGYGRDGSQRWGCKSCGRRHRKRAPRVGRIPLESCRLVFGLWEAGNPAREIERQTGHHRDTICRLLRRHGCDPGDYRGVRVALSRPGMVYLMKRPDGAVKIGASVDPARRRRQLQRCHGYAVELVDVFEVDDMAKAERSLHLSFAARRLRHEWFSLLPRHVAQIAAALYRPADNTHLGHDRVVGH